MRNRTLTNIAAGDKSPSEYVLSQLPNFVAAITDTNESVHFKCQLCWVVGNLAGDCDEYRATIIAAGLVPILLELLLICNRPLHNSTLSPETATELISDSRIVAFSLSNLARGTTSAFHFTTQRWSHSSMLSITTLACQSYFHGILSSLYTTQRCSRVCCNYAQPLPTQ